MENPDSSKMTMSEFYKTVGGDISDVIERLEDIDIVESFVLGFEYDPSYSELMKSLDEGDIKSAFRAAHTLKGICYNFGFKRLGDHAVIVCDKLREGIPPDEVLLQQLASEYNRVICAIQSLRNDN